MPWSGKSFASKHNKKLSGVVASKVAEQASAMVRSGVDEGIAIATANKRADKLQKRGIISQKSRDRRHLKEENIEASSR